MILIKSFLIKRFLYRKELAANLHSERRPYLCPNYQDLVFGS